jgi:hypothetical protein
MALQEDQLPGVDVPPSVPSSLMADRSVSATIGYGLYALLVSRAEANDRTVAQEVRRILREALNGG